MTSTVEELQYINNKENMSCVISFVQQQLCIYEEKTIVLLLFYAMYGKGHLDDEPRAVRINKAIYI